MCSLTALMVRCKASGLRYMPMRSIGLRNDESCAYAAEFSVIFESSKHVTGFGVRCGTPCAFMRVENMDEPAAPISGCGLAETVGEDTTAFAPILALLFIRMGPGDSGQSFCVWILAPTGLG